MSISTDNPALAKISIVIVTYNAAEVLQSCLNSIYKQKYPHIEIIVMDGASTDGTVDIIRENENNIAIWRSEKDEGIYDAMNKALNYISGEWIYFLGADDELFDEFSDLAYELKDASFIYYGSVLKNGIKYLGKLSAYKHAKLTICHQAMIYPLRVFEKYKFDKKYKISADHVLNMWCWKDSDFSFEFKDYIIANFNHNGISGTNEDSLFVKQKASLILQNYGFVIWLRFLIKQFRGKLMP